MSAAITTPPSNRAPTIVVPVLVAFGSGTPWAWRAALRLWLEKSKPAIAAVSGGWRWWVDTVGVCGGDGGLRAALEVHTAWLIGGGGGGGRHCTV